MKDHRTVENLDFHHELLKISDKVKIYSRELKHHRFVTKSFGVVDELES